MPPPASAAWRAHCGRRGEVARRVYFLPHLDTCLTHGRGALQVTAGMEIGNSLFDAKGAEIVPKLIEKAKAKG